MSPIAMLSLSPKPWGLTPNFCISSKEIWWPEVVHAIGISSSGSELESMTSEWYRTTCGV